MSAKVLASLRSDPSVTFTGPVDKVELYYSLIDVLLLPSYREGFPNAPLEAAAMCKPCITTDVLGCCDAVVHLETGLVVPVRNAPALGQAMLRLATDPDLRHRMGRAARERALADFNPQAIARELLTLAVEG